MEKTDYMEYYAKVKDVLTKFTNKPKPVVSNITKEKREANLNSDSCMVLTANKGISLVVIGKEM